MTVIRWIEEGRLSAFKTVGGHRRILREDLESFCRTRAIPWGPWGSGGASDATGGNDHAPPRRLRILLAMSAREADELEGHVRELAPEAELAVAATPLAAGLEIGRQPPDVVIVGSSPGVCPNELRGLLGRAVVQGAVGRSGQRAMRIVVVGGGEAERLNALDTVGAIVLEAARGTGSVAAITASDLAPGATRVA